MLPDRVSNPGPLTYESGALPIALRGPSWMDTTMFVLIIYVGNILQPTVTPLIMFFHVLQRSEI